MALFVIAKIWKQPRCPPIGAWVNKPWHTPKGSTMHHKMNETDPSVLIQSDLPDILLRKKEQDVPQYI